MPLTPEQFQKARDSGFSTEQIIGFEKKRESSQPTDRSKFETPEYQGGANSPALKEARGKLASSEYIAQNPYEEALAKTLPTAIGLPTSIPANIALALQQKKPLMQAAVEPITQDVHPDYKEVLQGAGMKPGLGTTAAGIGMDIALYPGGANGLYELGKLGYQGVSDAAKQLSKLPLPKIHNAAFVEGQAKNLKQVATGLDDAMHSLYDEFYNKQGLGNVPLDADKFDAILLKNNIPNNILSEIDTNIGKIDTVNKAHAANQLIKQRISEGAWQGTAMNPKLALKSTQGDIKDLMRSTTRSVNPVATGVLEDLDKLAYENIYPRIDKFNSMVGYGPKSVNYPNTAPVYSLMRGGLGKTSDINFMKDTPEKIAELGNYLKDPSFQKDLSETLNASSKFVKGMKSFQNRQAQKTAVGLGAEGSVLTALLQKLFKI